jgi:hypothetical protein
VFLKKSLHQPLRYVGAEDLCKLAITVIKQLLKAYPVLPTQNSQNVLTDSSRDSSSSAEFGVYHFGSRIADLPKPALRN